jgi:hypothetical protein
LVETYLGAEINVLATEVGETLVPTFDAEVSKAPLARFRALYLLRDLRLEVLTEVAEIVLVNERVFTSVLDSTTIGDETA